MIDSTISIQAQILEYSIFQNGPFPFSMHATWNEVQIYCTHTVQYVTSYLNLLNAKEGMGNETLLYSSIMCYIQILY